MIPLENISHVRNVHKVDKEVFYTIRKKFMYENMIEYHK